MTLLPPEKIRTAKLRPGSSGTIVLDLQPGTWTTADLVAVVERNVCPECRAGKHQVCNGDGGWDDETDQPVPCACWENAHQLGDL